MSKTVKAFGLALLDKDFFRKLFALQTPGNRIFPAKAGNNDAKHQLRLDAGEVIDGKKTIHLQVNSEATNEALKKWRQKHGTHANLATVSFDPDTPREKQKEVFTDVWKDVADQVKENLG